MGRGSSGAGGNLGKGRDSVNPANIHNERDLVSERERKQAEVDDVLSVARGIHDEYGVDVGQFMLADVGGKDALTMAYSDGTNIGFNSMFFNGKKMDGAYDACVKEGFHPSRGSKSGMEAVAAHEYGHVLTQQAGAKLGIPDMDNAAKVIVDRARKTTTHKGSISMAAKISGYAGHSNAECIAEAVSDVYCNGRKASSESRAIVRELNAILK